MKKYLLISFIISIIIMASGCVGINEPLRPGESAMPLLDFQSGQFIEIKN